jgi:hypothetical protein
LGAAPKPVGPAQGACSRLLLGAVGAASGRWRDEEGPCKAFGSCEHGQSAREPPPYDCQRPPVHRPAPPPLTHRESAPADITEPGAIVPITVWRLDSRDGDEPATDPGAGFASRLARRLVLTYTRQGETVVDFDADRHLRDAATASSRTYLAIIHPGELADLDAIIDPVSLVIVRWPRQTPARTAASVGDLFTACRLLMSADTCAIAAVSAAEPGQPGTAYAQHLAELLPAAQAAGLTHVLQIVAVNGSGNGDQFLYYATRAEADAARHTGRAIPDGPIYHIDLLVFATGVSRHD